MITDIAQSEMEKKLLKAKEGFERLPPDAAPFVFTERQLMREEVLTRYQKGLDLFEEVRRTRAAHEAAVDAQRNALAGLSQFHAEAMKVVRHHFGSDPRKMATFEAGNPKRSKRRERGCAQRGEEVVVTTVVEEVTTLSEQASCESQAPRSVASERRRQMTNRAAGES